MTPEQATFEELCRQIDGIGATALEAIGQWQSRAQSAELELAEARAALAAAERDARRYRYLRESHPSQVIEVRRHVYRDGECRGYAYLSHVGLDEAIDAAMEQAQAQQTPEAGRCGFYGCILKHGHAGLHDTGS